MQSRALACARASAEQRDGAIADLRAVYDQVESTIPEMSYTEDTLRLIESWIIQLERGEEPFRDGIPWELQ